MTVLPTQLTAAHVESIVESIVAATTEQLLRRLDTLPPGDPARATLRTRVIEENLPLTRRLARRYVGRGETFEDLAQVAALALVRAVDGFDPARDAMFIAYATPSIVGALKRHFRDATWGLHVPRSAQELVLRVRTAREELLHRLGRQPTTVELARHLDLTPDLVRGAELAVHAYRPGSIDATLSRVDGGPTVALTRALAVPDVDYVAVDNRLTVRALMATMPDRTRQILTMRYDQELTQTQIAAVLGVSQMQISRLLRRALNRLQATMTMSTDQLEPAGGDNRRR